jgi:transposase
LRIEQEKLQQENDELRLTIKKLQNQLYGRRSERVNESAGQLHLSFDLGEPLDAETLSALAALDQADAAFVEEFLARRRQRKKQPPVRSEELPAHLPRRTERIEPTLPEGAPFHLKDCQLIGVDVVETLEFERAQMWVRRVEYPKYKIPVAAESIASESIAGESLAAEPVVSESVMSAAVEEPADSWSTASVAAEEMSGTEMPTVAGAAVEPAVDAASAEGILAESTATEVLGKIKCWPPVMLPGHGILQALRLPNVIEGGRFGFGLVTEVLYNKFVLHLPLYRQQDTLAQRGWSPRRSTLCQIVANGAELLRPLADRLRTLVLSSGVLGTDDTPVTLLTPGEGDGSRTARFWLYRGRDGTPYDVFAFTDSREREGPDNFLAAFQGTVSGDCYGGYVNIEQVSGGRIRFSACWAHARRKIFDAREQQPLLASQLLAVIGQLYEVEDRARLLSDEARRELRQRQSTYWMTRLRALLDSPEAARVLPKSRFGEALAYLRNHWSAFQVYLSDGRIPMDNNDTERDLRRIALGRKNWLFLGSEEAGERTAVILSVISSAHRHDLDVWSYLRDVLECLAWGTDDLTWLLPENWKMSHPEHVRTFRMKEKQSRAEIRRFQRASRRLGLDPATGVVAQRA